MGPDYTLISVIVVSVSIRILFSFSTFENLSAVHTAPWTRHCSQPDIELTLGLLLLISSLYFLSVIRRRRHHFSGSYFVVVVFVSLLLFWLFVCLHNDIDSSVWSAINSRLFLTHSLRKKQLETIICLPFHLLSHLYINLKSFSYLLRLSQFYCKNFLWILLYLFKGLMKFIETFLLIRLVHWKYLIFKEVSIYFDILVRSYNIFFSAMKS